MITIRDHAYNIEDEEYAYQIMYRNEVSTCLNQHHGSPYVTHEHREGAKNLQSTFPDPNVPERPYVRGSSECKNLSTDSNSNKL